MRKLLQTSRLAALALVATVTASIIGVIVVVTAADSEKTDSPYPPETQEIVELERQWKAEAAKITPVPWGLEDGPFYPFGSPGTPRLLPTRVPGVPAGVGEIIDDFAKSDWICCYAKNWWVATAGGEWITLMAGSLWGDGAQGVVAMTVRDANGEYISDVRSGIHRTLEKEGALSVVGGAGMRVRLESESGSSYVFDAAQGRFVSPFLEPLPTPTPTPTPGPTAVTLAPRGTVAIDVVTGDRPPGAALGSHPIEGCRVANVGERFDVDIVIDGVTRANDNTEGLVGFDLSLAFDPSHLAIVEVDTSMLLAANDGSQVFDASDDPSNAGADGILSVAALDISTATAEAAEPGDGVLARLTVEVRSSGTSELRVLEGATLDAERRAATIETSVAGKVVVGESCS